MHYEDVFVDQAWTWVPFPHCYNIFVLCTIFEWWNSTYSPIGREQLLFWLFRWRFAFFAPPFYNRFREVVHDEFFKNLAKKKTMFSWSPYFFSTSSVLHVCKISVCLIVFATSCAKIAHSWCFQANMVHLKGYWDY